MKNIFIILVSFFLIFSSFSFIDRGDKESFIIYPSPIVKIAKVSSDSEIKKLEVYNLLGIKVLERDNQGDLDFTNLPSGYYIIKAHLVKGELIKRVQKY